MAQLGQILKQMPEGTIPATPAPSKPPARPVGIDTQWLKSHGLPIEYHAASIEKVNKTIQEKVANYLQNFGEYCGKGSGLLLTGTVGTGKTNILALVMLAAYKRYAFFVYCQDLFDTLIPKCEEDKHRLWQYEQAEVLCIDGFAEAYEHDWPYSKFELFIEKRKTAKLVTCMTTNLSMAEIKKNPRYIRLIDRLKTCCYAFEISGESRRKALDAAELSQEAAR